MYTIYIYEEDCGWGRTHITAYIADEKDSEYLDRYINGRSLVKPYQVLRKINFNFSDKQEAIAAIFEEYPHARRAEFFEDSLCTGASSDGRFFYLRGAHIYGAPRD